jgi:hypothetical protein
MFRPQKLPPIPYLLSNMIQPRKPRKFPEDERDIKTDKELARLPMEDRKNEVRPGESGFRVWVCAQLQRVLTRGLLDFRVPRSTPVPGDLHIHWVVMGFTDRARSSGGSSGV